LVDDDAGSIVRVQVTAANGAGSVEATSPPTIVVAPWTGPPLAVVLPAIPKQGQMLTATSGAWVGRPTGFAYSWQRCDAAGEGCVAIEGATGTTYVVGAADAGRSLRVAVTASNAVGSTTAVSEPVALP
jgi:hypothetical protein